MSQAAAPPTTTTAREPLRSALAWLASPVTVLAFVILAVNDHVLKQAHPGLLTGKLSDVAGMVGFPALLAVALAGAGVRRPTAPALLATGAGLALVKAVPVATVAAEAIWSLTGWPSRIVTDPTDLVALPALLLAWAAARRARRPRAVGARARLAVGAVVLPFMVLTTAATSCSQAAGVDSTGVVRGDWSGGQARREDRVVAGSVSVDDRGHLQALGRTDSRRLPDGPDGEVRPACSRIDPDRCWRELGDVTSAVAVTADGGRTWALDHVLDQRTADEVLEASEGCGEPGSVSTVRPSVLDGPDGPVVVVAAHHAGLLVRSPDGRWDRYSMTDLRRIAPGPAGPVPQGPLRWRVPAPEPPPRPWPSTPPPADGPTSPTTACPSPTTVRVTPDPRNGPPFDRVDCPP